MANSKVKKNKDDEQKEENISKFDKEIRENKKIPVEQRKKINKRIIFNGIELGIVLIYLVCFNISSLYTDTVIYLNISKIISVILAIISIIYFEFGYKKDDENIFLYGIEVFVIALITLFCCYAYELYFNNYNKLLLVITIIVTVYYLLKIIYVNRKMKKDYYKSLSDIKDITKKG